MTKTEELLALAEMLAAGHTTQFNADKAAAALREFAGTMEPDPVGTVTHAGHVDWYDQPPPAVWTKLYLHPPAPTTQEPVAWIGPYKSAWDALNELRKSCAEIIGADPETWPNHGNAPLAIAATLAIARTHMEQGTHPPAPSVPLTFIQERAQLDQEWSVLDAMKAAYKPTTPQSASVFGGILKAQKEKQT